MPDIQKINAVAIADIEKLDAVTAADIEKVNGLVFASAPAAGLAAAYSVRLLDSSVDVSGYTGPCMRVRRDSDNVEADVGFDTSDELSLTSPISNTSDAQSYTDFSDFVDHTGTPATAFVRWWYDQSGNSVDAGQSTAPDQPTIYNGGALLIRNGKPILTFADGTDHLDTASISFDGPHTFFSCAYNQNSFNSQQSFMYHSTGNFFWVNAVNKVQIQNGSEAVAAVGAYGNNSEIISCVIDGSNSLSRGKNSVVDSTQTGTITTETINAIRLGAQTTGRETDVQEYIWWNVAQDSTNRAAIEIYINNHFGIF